MQSWLDTEECQKLAGLPLNKQDLRLFLASFDCVEPDPEIPSSTRARYLQFQPAQLGADYATLPEREARS